MGNTVWGFQDGLYVLSAPRSGVWNTGGVEDSGPVPSWITSTAQFIGNIRDIKATDSATDGDVSVRVPSGAPFHRSQGGMLKWAFSGELLYQLQDANYALIRRALHLRTTIPLLIMRGTLGLIGAEGYLADWTVLKCEPDQKLDGPGTSSFEVSVGLDANVNYPPQYVTVTT